jgi:hypothetical protein
MTDEERMNEIRNDWFKNHKATYEKLSDDTSVLTWKKDGTLMYYVRYIFDRNRLFITGDIGDAVFVLTERADMKTIATEYHNHYLFGKLRADNEAYDFDQDKAIETLKSHFKQYEFDDDDEWNEFNEMAEEIYSSIKDECNTEGQWATVLNCDYYDNITEYDVDCWEWIYHIGKELSWQALGWVVGLQMAYKQLKSNMKF